jgi:hypothetical protein
VPHLLPVLGLPQVFNTVDATALKKLNISEFPLDVNELNTEAVYYLVFADDLVLLSGNLTKLEEKSNELDAVLSPLGMALNVGKTKWMGFLPTVVPRGLTLATRPVLSLCIDGNFVENVDQFVYLGFSMDWSLSKRHHQKRREQLQTIAAKSMGKLLRSLEVTNLISIRSYYVSLVRAQLYSLCFSTFSSEEFDRAQKVFLENIFSLPSSYPIQVACFFVGVPDFL